MKTAIFIMTLVCLFVLGLTPAIAAEVDLTPDSALEAYLFFGHKTRTSGGDNQNDYLSGKVRYRPGAWNNKVAGTKVDLGVFALGQIGSGEAGSNDTNYDWKKAGGGMTSRISTSSYWYLKIDIGAAYLKSSAPGDQQTDVLALANANYRIEQRRAVGNKFLPQTDVYAGIEVPLSSDRTGDKGKHLKTSEQGSADLVLTQTIIDIPVAPGHVISPAVLVGVGQSGVKEEMKGSWQYGGQVAYRYKGNDLVTVTATEKKVDDQNDQRIIVGLSYSW